MKWIDKPTNLLTIGIREAYLHGLEMAVPTGTGELGWAMATRSGTGNIDTTAKNLTPSAS
jgi:hypothetical protein